jgi:hypothetical protein
LVVILVRGLGRDTALQPRCARSSSLQLHVKKVHFMSGPCSVLQRCRTKRTKCTFFSVNERRAGHGGNLVCAHVRACARHMCRQCLWKHRLNLPTRSPERYSNCRANGAQDARTYLRQNKHTNAARQSESVRYATKTSVKRNLL